MRALRVVAGVFVVTATVVLGVQSLVVVDSPDASNVAVERIPHAPERPAELTAASAANYTTDYERRRLYNDLLATRAHELDEGEAVVANCTTTAVAAREPGFRVGLRCTGGIKDVYRLVGSGTFDYRVAYRVTEDAIAQVDIEGYPHGERAGLRLPPPRGSNTSTRRGTDAMPRTHSSETPVRRGRGRSPPAGHHDSAGRDADRKGRRAPESVSRRTVRA